MARSRLVRSGLIALLIALSVPTLALAQRGGGRGGRGGGPPGGGFGGSPLSVLEEDSVVSELGLSEDQRSQISAIAESARPDFTQMMPLIMEMRSAESDEQRSEIRQRMAEIASAPAKAAEEKLKTLLTPAQFDRYQQASRQRTGVRGLLSETEATALGLSDEQRAKLEEKGREMFSQFRELRNLPEEEQQAARDKMEADLLSVLTDSQRKLWNDRLGEPIEGLSNRRGGGDRRGDGRPSGDGRQRGPVASTAPQGGQPSMSENAPSSTPPASGDPLDAMLGALESAPAGPNTPAVDPNSASVADFGQNPGDGPADSFSFNFSNAPWADVLRLFASTAGLTLDLSVTPPGAFNYYDSNTYTPEEALDVLNGYLLPRGYLLLKRDKFLVVTSISEGISPSLIPTVAAASLDDRGQNELVRVIFETGQTPASDIVADVQSLLGAQGQAVAMGASNRLVAEDIVRNLLEVRSLLADTTRPVGPDGLAFRAYRLQYIDARGVEPLVKALLGVGSELGASGSSSSSRSSSDDRRSQFFEMMRSRMGGGPPGFGGGDRGSRGGSSSSSSSEKTENTGTARVAVDDRTNTLLVTAKPSDLDIVAQAVEQLDVADSDAAMPGQADTDGPMLRVYKIDDGDLGKVSETLMSMVPGIAINADDRADQLHVVATRERHAEVADLVEMITGRAGAGSVAVIPLARMDAYSAGQLVANMFAGDADATGLSVQADPTGRRLIVRGSSSEVAQVKSLLLQLGETGEAAAAMPVQRGPIRELRLGGQDPQKTLRLLQQLWNAGHDRRLQIVDPQGSGPAVEAEGQSPAGSRLDPSASINRRASSEAYFVAAEVEPEEKPGVVSAAVIGDRLVLSSSDLDSLDDLESLAARLLEQTQSQTKWTVIYLQVATTADALSTLQSFFPQAQIGGAVSTSSIDSIATTSTLRIIPEERTNALFLSGSPAEIADVQDVLRIVDSSDIPTSLRARVPRSIPVEYANAVEVAEVLRDVFVDLIAQPVQNQRGGQFGRETETQTSIQPGQMTIGVDVNTSRIVVASDEALFKQVESIVLELDEAAREAKRSVRVVNLQNTNPAAVKDVLGTLLPQVSFTTSTSRTSTSSSRSGDTDRSRGSSSGSSSNPFDFFRRMREQREREGGSGGRPSFGGPGGGGFGGFGGGRPGGGRPGGDRGGR